MNHRTSTFSISCRKPTANRCVKSALTLIITALGSACGYQNNGAPAEETAKTTSHLTVTQPTPVAWWSFDEKCSTRSVYDSQPLPAVSNGTKYNHTACVEGKIGRAVSFDGGNDYVSIPNQASHQFSNAMTISAWAKPGGTTGTIAGKWGTQNSYRLLLSGGKYAFSVTLSAGTVVTATASAMASTTSYSHVAGVFNGSRAVLYVNGTQAASASASGSLRSSTDAIRIGRTTSSTSPDYYKGAVDELRLYNAALSSAQISRLVNGPQHRRLRAVAFDPKFVSESGYVGKRLHEHTDLIAAGWRSPQAVVQYWMEYLNAAAGERLYLPEDGSYANAVKYVEEVSLNNNGNICFLTPGSSLETFTAEDFLTRYHDHTLPPDSKFVDLFRMVKAYNPSLGFDLVADANGQSFHELITIEPGNWGIGGEGAMVGDPSDSTIFAAHQLMWQLAGIKQDKKFIVHGLSYQRDDRAFEQFAHRAERILEQTWATSITPYHCDNPGSHGYDEGVSLSELRNAYDLFTLNDREITNQANVGCGHYMPNTFVGYVRWHQDRVPSAYQYWANFPAGYPVDLTRNDRRTPVSCEAWGCSNSNEYNAFVWQISKYPKAEGMLDGRNNNWWMYISNPNYQVGRGLPTNPPFTGPTHGAMDFTLTIYSDRIGLAWMTEVSGKGTYTVQRSTNRNNWTNIGTANGSTGKFDAARPSNGVDTFYRVVWNDGTISRYSDQLGVNLGSATPVNMSGNQRPPVNPSISLLQQRNPYVRWELPTTCGRDNAVANAPCNLDICGGPCMTCLDNQCRVGAKPASDSELWSDYHLGQARYLVQKRGASFTTVWTVERRPGWEGQYNHVHFSSADDAVPANTVVGYRVSAYQLVNGTQGAEWGHTDVLLAVAGTSTVGTIGTTPCAGLCLYPEAFTGPNYQSGNLGTGAICRETTANLSGGNCSNMSNRALTVNGATMNCTNWTLPAKRNGGYCVQVTPGTPEYASFATW